MLIKINTILIPEGRRPLRDIQAFAQSIKEIGLLNPILVTGDRRLVAGYHRLEACKALGWKKIEANIVSMSEIDRELAEIDENLIRNELSCLARSEHLKRRKEIYEVKYPETKQGGTPGAGRGKGKKKKEEIISSFQSPSFAADTADKTGYTPRTIRQEIQIATRLTPDLKEEITEAARKAPDTPLAALDDSKTDLLALARMKPEGQRACAREIKSGKAKNVKEAKKRLKKKARVEQIQALSQNSTPLTGDRGPYPVILADPPWKYDYSPTEERAIENQYPTMPLEEICSLSVPEITTPDCILFLWATSPKLSEALKVVEAWGFIYKTCMVWVKDKIGMGYYTRQQHELLLIAIKGEFPVPDPENRPSSVIHALRPSKHSEKPEQFYEVIEKMYPDFKKKELFQREPREGWDGWGYEANNGK